MNVSEYETLDQMQPETFEETRNSQTKFWKDIISEDDWECFERDVLD